MKLMKAIGSGMVWRQGHGKNRRHGSAPAPILAAMLPSEKHTKVVVLSDKTGKAQWPSPGLAGRVMTSTTAVTRARALAGSTRIHRRRQIGPAHDAFGGEERFWMGRKEGSSRIYFAKGVAV